MNTRSHNDRPYLLVVEDSPTTMAVIAKHLAGHFDFISAKNGEEAWQLLQNDPKIELVITDINMPKLSGFELLERIRQSENKQISELPVFIMTTNDDSKEKDEALLKGANDFITKPINPLVLRARVNVHHKVSTVIRQQQAPSAKDQDKGTDLLTDLNTKERLIELAESKVTESLEHGNPLTLLLIEIENFKAIDEAHGLQAGESVLANVAKLLKKLIRDVDIAARIGDDRFAVVLSNTKQLGTTLVAQRIRTTIERTSVDIGGKSINISASIGISMIPDDIAKTISGLLEIAANRLGIARNLGGNRICVNDQGDENFST